MVDSGMIFWTILPLLLPLVFGAIGVICGFVSMTLAKSRGLSPALAFFAGFFGTITAMFLIAMLPKKAVA